VVIGKGFGKETVEGCERIADGRTELIYFPDAERMKRLMLESDIAVSGGGQTLYEMARLGLPAVAIIVAENQSMQVRSFFKKGFLLNFFWWDRFTEKDLINAVKNLYDPRVRRKLADTGRNLVNGQGARRLVKLYLITAMFRLI